MYIDSAGNRFYKVALHQHTTRSDGHISPEEVVAIYKAAGYDAIALTDHWVYANDGEIDGMTILPGCEYNLGRRDTIAGVMHIIGVGMQTEPNLTPQCPRQEVVDRIREAGGLAILGHPHWSMNTPQDLFELNGIFATEIYNAISDTYGNIHRDYSDYFVDLCANQGVYPYLLATDDSHHYEGLDNCQGWVMVQADACTTKDILAALEAGKFFATQGPFLSAKREGNTIQIDCSPCTMIGVNSNLTCRERKNIRGENLTHFTYELGGEEVWVRAQVVDADGKIAWSNIIPIL